MCIATYSIQKLSMSLVEELSKYKFDFEDLRKNIADFNKSKYCTADSEESLRQAANIATNSVSIRLQEKKIINENKTEGNFSGKYLQPK